jgi:hypothetical protein
MRTLVKLIDYPSYKCIEFISSWWQAFRFQAHTVALWMHKSICQIDCAMQRRVHMTYVPFCNEIKRKFLDTDDRAACVCTCVYWQIWVTHPLPLMIRTRDLSLQIVKFLLTICMVDSLRRSHCILLLWRLQLLYCIQTWDADPYCCSC